MHDVDVYWFIKKCFEILNHTYVFALRGRYNVCLWIGPHYFFQVIFRQIPVTLSGDYLCEFELGYCERHDQLVVFLQYDGELLAFLLVICDIDSRGCIVAEMLSQILNCMYLFENVKLLEKIWNMVHNLFNKLLQKKGILYYLVFRMWLLNVNSDENVNKCCIVLLRNLILQLNLIWGGIQILRM